MRASNVIKSVIFLNKFSKLDKSSIKKNLINSYKLIAKENNPPKKRKLTKIVNNVEIENNKINGNNKRYSIINKNNNNAKKNKINILIMNNINDNQKTIEETDESKK